MSNALARWLQRQFATVSDVRRASTEPDNSVIFQQHTADVVVSTWMGARLYIYTLHQPPSVRDIKNTLKENSRSGIGSLFIINNGLLPANDEKVHVTDWQEALFSLHDDFIYSYVIEDGQVSLSQVHFTPLGGSSGEFRVWHMPNFEINSVHVRKQHVNGNLRGDYHLGDIASPSYKRKVNYERVNQRYHYKTKYSRETPRGTENGAAGRNRRQQIRSPHDDETITKSYAILGIEQGASQADVKKAYRRRAMQVHPDVSALPRAEADRRFKELNRAYDVVKSHQGWS